jgi:hypothetical protein
MRGATPRVLHLSLPSRSLAWASDLAGLAGPSPKKLCWAGPSPVKKNKKSRKIKNKKYVCMDKNNVNLLVYSLTPESGIKYRFKFILFLFIVFYFI